MKKFQNPNSKFQKSCKLQASMSLGAVGGVLEFEHWNFLGTWNLELGVLP
jgi:hypothetical protein